MKQKIANPLKKDLQQQGQKSFKSLYERVKYQQISKGLLYRGIQDKNVALNKQNKYFEEQLQQSKKLSDDVITNQNFHIQLLQERTKQLIVGRRQLQIKYDTLKITHQSLMTQFEIYKQSKYNELQQLYRKNIDQKKQFQNTLGDYRSSIEAYHQFKQANAKLQQQLDYQKERVKQIQADKDCQRILSIDAIKKQMTKQAYQMRNKAAEIRKQQLTTTTRLTYLQNDQLIRQLQYQSSNTQKIMKKNLQLQGQVKKLKQDLQIHIQVEKQVTRRNVFARNYIKNIQAKNNNINEVQQKQEQSPGKRQSFTSTLNVPRSRQKERVKRRSRSRMNAEYQLFQQKLLAQQAIIKSLEHKLLNKSAQRNSGCINQQTLDEIKKDNKSTKFEGNYQSIAYLLNKYYHQILNGDKNILNKQQIAGNKQMELIDFNNLKELKVEEWPQSSIISVVKIMLSLIKPHLTKKSVKFPCFSQYTGNSQTEYNKIKQENLYIPPYISALKRRQQKSLYSKGRSLTNLTNSNEIKSKKPTKHHKQNNNSNDNILLNSVANRFLKPKLKKMM